MNYSTERLRNLAIAAAAIAVAIVVLWLWSRRAPAPLTTVVTVAIAGPQQTPVKNLYQPYGIAVDDDGTIYFTESVTGKIYRMVVGSPPEAVVDGLETPSAIVVDEDDRLIVANTGAHTIVRIDPKSRAKEVVAGTEGVSGADDGHFNGPIGLAMGKDGTIFVADTYNDRIRAISTGGQMRTIAGSGEAGFTDGQGTAARFDTPCGLAVMADGSLLVADTGNHRLRRIDPSGNVTTIAGTGEAAEIDGAPTEAAFDEPISLARRDQRSFYVADHGGSTIRLLELGETPSVKTLTGAGAAGYFASGMADGLIESARLNRPAGLALLPSGELVLADLGNGLIRAVVPDGAELGFRADPARVLLQPTEMQALMEPRWPYHPPENRRDIAGVMGEIRGERLPDHDAWFHAGLDIPGAYGETVLALLTERVTRPLAVSGAGDLRERLRLPLFEYIHLRIGRDRDDRPLGNFPPGAITFRLDAGGQVIGVRIRRGTLIKAGDPLGTLNRYNHVHLNAGPASSEFNALLVVKLPGLIDTTPPLIESVRLVDERFQPLPALKGKTRIVVRAYDQVNGNPRYRRLGLYRLGYQLLRPDGTPLPDYRQPLYTIVFDRLANFPEAVELAYAEGSQSGYAGITIFDYLATNLVRHGEAREAFLDLSSLAPGEYRLRVLAEDFAGNQTKREIPLIKQ